MVALGRHAVDPLDGFLVGMGARLKIFIVMAKPSLMVHLVEKLALHAGMCRIKARFEPCDLVQPLKSDYPPRDWLAAAKCPTRAAHQRASVSEEATNPVFVLRGAWRIPEGCRVESL
jgi:hypothetical protein